MSIRFVRSEIDFGEIECKQRNQQRSRRNAIIDT
jgi:hypothetical protein